MKRNNVDHMNAIESVINKIQRVKGEMIDGKKKQYSHIIGQTSAC